MKYNKEHVQEMVGDMLPEYSLCYYIQIHKLSSVLSGKYISLLPMSQIK